MKRSFSLVVATLILMWSALASAQGATTWRGKSIDDFYRYFGPDLDIQGGLGHRWDVDNSSQSGLTGFGRVRFGALWVPKWPWSFSLGGTAEVNSLPAGLGGVQGEVLHLGSGLWLRAGVGLDPYIRPHMNAAGGWSFFGLEVSAFPRRALTSVGDDPREGVALQATIRIPIGFILYVFDKR